MRRNNRACSIIQKEGRLGRARWREDKNEEERVEFTISPRGARFPNNPTTMILITLIPLYIPTSLIAMQNLLANIGWASFNLEIGKYGSLVQDI